MAAEKKARKQRPEFPADSAILSAKEDFLGRARFAKGLAKRIRSRRGQDSVVIALCGEWGCGKTSLKNMILEDVRRGRSDKVDILEFNPWEVSGHGSVAAAFFSELVVKIAPTDSAEKKQKQEAAERLDRYGKLLAFGGKALKVIGNSMDVMLIPGGSAIRYVGNLGTQAGEIATSGAQAQTATSTREPTLGELKRLLCEDMAKLARPILVVIDDIDRLTHDEIREVFQLVKANANFPNLTYLLMFDRAIVASALDSISGDRGHEFLEKIVQLPLDVPQPLIDDVHKVLRKGIAAHLVKPEIDERWENDRWQQIWLAGLSGYFPNLRCVHRFLGSFDFYVSHMEDGGAFELNPLDLFVLETFRLFEPSLYAALSVRQTLLTDPKFHKKYITTENKNDLIEAEISELLSLCKQPSRQEELKEMLEVLFPALLMNNRLDQAALLRYLRVGHKDCFSRYFSFSLSPNEVFQADVDALRQSFASPANFYKLCQKLNSQGKLGAVFIRLEAYKESLPDEVFPAIIISMVNAADLLPLEKDQGPLSVDTLTYASRLIRIRLRKFEDEQVRFDHLKEGLVQSTGLLLAVNLLANEERYPDRRSSEFLISEGHWAELKPIVVQRIRDAATSLTLKTAQDLSYILWRWNEWAGIDEVRQWLATCLQTGEDALWILRTFLSTSTSYGSKMTYTRYLSHNTLTKFSDVETLSTLTQDYNLNKLSQDDMRALRAFRYALKWKAEGKPDDYWRDHLDDDNPLGEGS